jgi:branched-chain amino acid transport system substrate-binding protein
LDRKAIREYVANNTHDTVIGKIKFNGSENVSTPGSVSQWQKGEFEVVWPKSMATGSLTAKPAWV